MSSIREQVLLALYAKLQTLASAHVKVYRNMDKPQKVDGGIIILRDGTSEPADMLLSPLTYIYQHSALVEVLSQNADPVARDSQLDALLVSIGNLILANRSLGGLAEWTDAEAPVFLDEPIDGAGGLKMAQVSVSIRFATTNPLN